MKTIQTLIENNLAGNLIAGEYIKIQNSPYMPLTVEIIGEGPNGLPQVAVSHHFVQNGDLMRDPEIVFEVENSAGIWGFHPVEVTMDPVGRYVRAVWLENGNVMKIMKEVRDLNSFSRIWDRNLKAQGFLKAPVKTNAATTITD